MSDLDDTKPKSAEETLKIALEHLEDMRFNMACFVDGFKRYLIKSNIILEGEK